MNQLLRKKEKKMGSSEKMQSPRTVQNSRMVKNILSVLSIIVPLLIMLFWLTCNPYLSADKKTEEALQETEINGLQKYIQ